MAAEFIQNPRRSPRSPVRCTTAVVSAHGAFEATTEDLGRHGCQLVSPRLVRKGEPIQLVVAHEAMKDPLRVAGRVAWASDRAPWRLGIAYDEPAHSASQAWFDELLSRVPGLSAFRRIPDRIPLDAVVYLATPPRFLVDFTPDEVALLRSVGSGTSLAELRALLRDRWDLAQRALFSLLAHQHVTLARGGSVHPDAWRKILSEAEASLAVESLRGAPVPDFTPAPLPRSAAPAPPALVPGAAADWPRPAPPAPRPAAAPVPQARPVAAARAPQQAVAEAAPTADEAPDWLVSAAEMLPTNWPSAVHPPPAAARGPGSGPDEGAASSVTPPPLTGGFALPAAFPRSQEAQGCYQRGLVELEAGRLAGALALLRRAMALAPGDPEISGALAQVTERMRG